MKQIITIPEYDSTFTFDCDKVIIPINLAKSTPVGVVALDRDGKFHLVGSVNKNGGRCSCCSPWLVGYFIPNDLAEAIEWNGRVLQMCE